MQSRTLESIHTDLKLITSNKLNSYQSKLFLVGIVHEILQRRDLFPKNIDLKNFVHPLFVEPFPDIEDFKDYLFAGRPLLSSKISNIILYKFEYHNVISTTKFFSKILPQNEYSTPNFNNKIELEMSHWINFLKGD